MARSSEEEIAQAVIKYLDTLSSKEDTVSGIIKNLPKFIQLSAEDRQTSNSRTSEQNWEQQVRNIVSHRNSPGNAIYDGRLSYCSSTGKIKKN